MNPHCSSVIRFRTTGLRLDRCRTLAIVLLANSFGGSIAIDWLIHGSHLSIFQDCLSGESTESRIRWRGNLSELDSVHYVISTHRLSRYEKALDCWSFDEGSITVFSGSISLASLPVAQSYFHGLESAIIYANVSHLPVSASILQFYDNIIFKHTSRCQFLDPPDVFLETLLCRWQSAPVFRRSEGSMGSIWCFLFASSCTRKSNLIEWLHCRSKFYYETRMVQRRISSINWLDDFVLRRTEDVHLSVFVLSLTNIVHLSQFPRMREYLLMSLRA